MILTRIQIENYKQYCGACEIEIPAQATVGVIGENGTGKTTLFEAIEWCLYSPRSISASDVRPRTVPGPTTVSVHLESTDGTQRYIVERVLKRSPSATIYRVDEAGDLEPIVQGPKQVTDYVSGKLIGLSHTAFTATFFTRQKELHLFGDQTPGRRREEVGRLLGLETIRTAQRRFTAERSKANAEAKAMAAHYEREAQGRDFATELAEAEAVIVHSGMELATSAREVEDSRKAGERAEAALATAQGRREEDGQLAQQLSEHTRERQAQQARLAQIAADLARIESRNLERRQLAPIAARLQDLQAAITTQEQERSRFEQASELDRVRRDIAQRRQDQHATVLSIVEGVGQSPEFLGWQWTTDDAVDAIGGVDRLLAVITGIDLAAAEGRARAIRNAHDAARHRDDARKVLDRFQAERDKIDRDEQALLANGEPRDALTGLDREREKLLGKQTTCFATRTSLEGERDKTRALLANLVQRQFDDRCPTCGRPFGESDAEIVIAAMRQREAGFDTRIDELTAEAAVIDQQLRQGERARKEVFDHMDRLEKVRQRIQKSVGVLDKQLATVADAESALASALAEAALTGPPVEADLEVAAISVRRYQAHHHARPSLQSTRAALLAHLDADRSVAAERAALGEVAFDQVAYQALVVACQEADRAQAAIDQIDRELSRKPELEIEHQAVAARIAELDEAIARFTAQRTVLGYDPAELAGAQSAVGQARNAERAAVETYHRSQAALQQAETRRDSISKEQERLARLAAAVDTRQSEADHLELMAKEFTEFERYAAARKVPVLGEFTSALVRSITDGRYERVEFDQDFGIVVHDGADTESSYAVDTFSGGERDAITLAARIALSQMIGRQATNPPGFLVLDEVFGSLDSDRRAHLLDLLGSITATFDGLRQVFIISHVDDVRTSPVLDELWRVEASEEGVSKVLSLRPGSEIDAL